MFKFPLFRQLVKFISSVIHNISHLNVQYSITSRCPVKAALSLSLSNWKNIMFITKMTMAECSMCAFFLLFIGADTITGPSVVNENISDSIDCQATNELLFFFLVGHCLYTEWKYY